MKVRISTDPTLFENADDYKACLIIDRGNRDWMIAAVKAGKTLIFDGTVLRYPIRV